ncbi:MAG TPA: hypothetical protein VGK19_17735 [Capsulimonadaceae bacterium]|jgi:ABC-type polysaccharide/polyol phosphate export permease
MNPISTPRKSDVVTRIAPEHLQGFGIVTSCRDIWAYRSTLMLLTRRQIRLRYKNSVIGLAWSVLFPLAQTAIMTILVKYILGSGPPNASAFILCALLPWTFFATAVLDSAASVLGQTDMLRKVYMPREILPLATILANLVHMLMGIVVFLIYRYGLTTVLSSWPGAPPVDVAFLPLVILIELGIVIGVSFVVCAWTTFYEDVKYIAQICLNAMYFLMPILFFAENIYYSERIPEGLRKIIYDFYLLFPMTWVITAFKQMFFHKQNIAPVGHVPILSAPLDYRIMAGSAVVSVFVALGGIAYFNKVKWKFTERP